MKRLIQRSILVPLLMLGCVEPYEFNIQDENPHLVIDSYFSDKSFNETLSYPSDGRYFSVKLRSTSEVSNVRDQVVSGAVVGVRDDQGNSWIYTETEPGLYLLLDKDVKALPGNRYQQFVVTGEGRTYESQWSALPDASIPMGDVSFIETEKFVYKYESGEQVIKSAKGIDVTVAIPRNNYNDRVYYRWTATPMWIYTAPLQGGSCWIIDPYYLADYALLDDMTGNYRQPLFFIETVRNDRVYKKFSALIVQQVLNEEHYFFWKELKEQNLGGLLADKPPYNLGTNYYATGETLKASGYFGPVREEAVRWYFLKSQLSYNVEDTSLADCQIYGLDIAPQCFNCHAYAYGQALEKKPDWWED